MRKKRLCMVGAGRVGRLHTRNITERVGHRAEVAAIVDPDRRTAEELAGDYDVSVVCSSLDEALEGGDFDGVVITTPTFTHHPLAVRALDAGLHVHLEKPMAMNLRECAEIKASAERAGAALQVGFMRRFDHDFIQAAELLRSGAIGAPVIIKSLTHGPGLPPPWANDIRTSNGMLAEVNSHDLDTVGWFASRGVSTEHFYDTMLATITFESGALASIAGVCPADYGYDARVEVTCTGGMVQVGETGPAGLVSISAGQARRCAPVFASWRDRFADAYAGEMAEFVAATDGAPVRVGAEDGTRAVALVLAGTLSMLEERTVSLTEVTSPAFVPSWQAAAQSEA